MKTTINKIFQVDHPIDIVWDYLADPTKIVSCVPGASLTEKIDDRNFKGKVSLKFGPVKAKYDGKITRETSKTTKVIPTVCDLPAMLLLQDLVHLSFD